MSLTVALTSFLAVLPAELPDKTVLACLILSSRYRPWYVFVGAAAAFTAQVVLAVAAGGALSLLPHRVGGGAGRRRVPGRGGAALAAEAAVTIKSDEDDIGRDGLRNGFWPVAATRSRWCSSPSSVT